MSNINRKRPKPAQLLKFLVREQRRLPESLRPIIHEFLSKFEIAQTRCETRRLLYIAAPALSPTDLYRVLQKANDCCYGTEETDSERKYINDNIDEDQFSYLQDIPDKDCTTRNYLILARVYLCQFVQFRLADWLMGHIDSDRDTPEQVETLVRFFPELLDPHQFSNYLEKRYISFRRMNKNLFVQMAASVKAVSFIPLLAQLSLELHSDSGAVVGSRGGLLFYAQGYDANGLRAIVSNCNYNTINGGDTKYIDVLKELRANNLLFKEDIQREDLLHCALRHCCSRNERHIRYLVELDPASLTRAAESNNHTEMTLPLHLATESSHYTRFRLLLELGIQYYPIQAGFLFQENSSGDSPFVLASNKFGSSIINSIFETILATVANTTGDDDVSRRKLLEAMVYLATEESVDGVYIMLRRDPSILSRALLGSNRKRAREE